MRYLGFLPEHEKAAALAGARAVVCPSPFESLSIALLEGFALGVPGLVNARSEVLKEHCLRSGASSSTRTATSTPRPSTPWRATPRFVRRSVRVAAATWRPSTAGT